MLTLIPDRPTLMVQVDKLTDGRGKQMTKEITTSQHEALKAFATANGRGWKKELQFQWMKATATPELHALRNSHGPRWLAKFKI